MNGKWCKIRKKGKGKWRAKMKKKKKYSIHKFITNSCKYTLKQWDMCNAAVAAENSQDEKQEKRNKE